MTEWIESLKVVENMDFEILAPGHSRLGDKSDVSAFRGYMEYLYNAVLTQARAGKSLEEMKQSIQPKEYKNWWNFKNWWLPNIEGMYREVQRHRL